MKSQFHSKSREDCDWPAWVTWPPVMVGEDPALSLARSVHMTFLDLGVDQLYSDHRERLVPPGKIRHGTCSSLSRGPLECEREAEPRAGAEKLPMRYKTKSPMGPCLQLVFGRQSCFCWPQTRLRQGPCRGQQGRLWSISLPASLAQRPAKSGGSEKVLGDRAVRLRGSCTAPPPLAPMRPCFPPVPGPSLGKLIV